MLDLDRSTWTRVRFEDLAHNVKDRVDDPSASGHDRYVGLEHLDSGSLSVTRWGDPSSVTATKLVFEPGDVIFGRRRAYQRKVSQAHFAGIASAHALVLRAKKDVVSERFLPVFLSSDYFLDRAISISVGSLSPTVNWRDLARQEFDLPPLDEQDRIADLLWAIEQHRLALKSVAGHLADAAARHFTAMASNIESRQVLLGDVLSVVRGGSPRPISAYLTDEADGLNWIKIGDVPSDGKYIDGTAEKILPSGVAKTRVVKPGDFLLSNSMSFGRPYIVRIHGCIHDGWLALSDDNGLWRTDYLYHMLRSDIIQWQFKSRAAGSTVKNLNIDLVRSVEVALPPIDAQDEILEAVSRWEDAARDTATEQDRLTQLRLSVVEDLFGSSSSSGDAHDIH